MFLTEVEEAGIALVGAERATFSEEIVDRFPAKIVTEDFSGAGRFGRRLRHDLAPPETSQIIVSFIRGDEAIGHVEISPAVVIEINKLRAPSPTGHDGAG